MKELELIERIREGVKARNPAVRLGIGDDCAVLRVPAGHEMVVTTDFSLEGRHFRREWHTPQSAGHRCLARGLSDLAAMGAKPIAAFLSLALPRGFEVEWVDGFMEGFEALAQRFGVELAGGDTAEAPGGEILADVVCVGAVRKGNALLRSGAQAGDGIFVTGRLGGAAVELARLAAGGHCPGTVATAGKDPHAFPEPRLKAGFKLAEWRIATACMDVSDGLSTDLRHLCDASGVGAEIASAEIPLAAGATLEQALHGGEDYELLFTSKVWSRVPNKLATTRVQRIGRVTAESGVRIDGVELVRGGWEHFGETHSSHGAR
jgi:thiamine-monophosphate kinase